MRIFRHMDHMDGQHLEDFILQMYKSLDVRTYPEFSNIVKQGDPQDGLYIMHQGVAQVVIVPPREGDDEEQTADRSSEFATVFHTFAFTSLCFLRCLPSEAVF